MSIRFEGTKRQVKNFLNDRWREWLKRYPNDRGDGFASLRSENGRTWVAELSENDAERTNYGTRDAEGVLQPPAADRSNFKRGRKAWKNPGNVTREKAEPIGVRI